MERKPEIDLACPAVVDRIADRGLGREVGDVIRVREQDVDDFPGDVPILASRRVDQVVVSGSAAGFVP